MIPILAGVIRPKER